MWDLVWSILEQFLSNHWRTNVAVSDAPSSELVFFFFFLKTLVDKVYCLNVCTPVCFRISFLLIQRCHFPVRLAEICWNSFYSPQHPCRLPMYQLLFSGNANPPLLSVSHGVTHGTQRCGCDWMWTVSAGTPDMPQTESLHRFWLFLFWFLGAIFALTICWMSILLGCALPGPMQTSGIYNLKCPRLYNLNHCFTSNYFKSAESSFNVWRST